MQPEVRASTGFAGLTIGLTPHPYPPHLHPDLHHVGQRGALDGDRVLQRQRRTRAALGVLAGTADRRGHRRNRVPVSIRQARRTRRPPSA